MSCTALRWWGALLKWTGPPLRTNRAEVGHPQSLPA